jgi:mono/diheme cytochrome c family protein
MFERAQLVAMLLVPTVCMLLIGCDVDFPGKPDPADRPLPQNEITDFATLFAQNCSGCHGADGELGPAPPLNDPLFLALIPDDALSSVIRDGRPGTPMPAFAADRGGTLTAEQVNIIAAGVKSHWPAEKDDGEESSANLEGAPPYLAMHSSLQLTPGATELGAALFERACAECHGANGAGGDTGYASGGAINDPAFLALISDQALRRIIITGRHDLGMPNYAETDGRPDDFTPLTSEEIDELVALLASWRRGDVASATAGD